MPIGDDAATSVATSHRSHVSQTSEVDSHERAAAAAAAAACGCPSIHDAYVMSACVRVRTCVCMRVYGRTSVAPRKLVELVLITWSLHFISLQISRGRHQFGRPKGAEVT